MFGYSLAGMMAVLFACFAVAPNQEVEAVPVQAGNFSVLVAYAFQLLVSEAP